MAGRLRVSFLLESDKVPEDVGECRGIGSRGKKSELRAAKLNEAGKCCNKGYMKMEVEIYLIKLLLLSQIVNTLVLVLILYVLDQFMKTPPK